MNTPMTTVRIPPTLLKPGFAHVEPPAKPHTLVVDVEMCSVGANHNGDVNAAVACVRERIERAKCRGCGGRVREIDSRTPRGLLTE